MFWKYDTRNWLQYTCVGTQFTLTFCLGVGGGIWLDGKQGTMPGYTITGAVLGFAVGLRNLIQQAQQIRKQGRKRLAEQSHAGPTNGPGTDRQEK